MIHAAVSNYLYIWVRKYLSLMIVAVPVFIPYATLLPYSGKLEFCIIQKLGWSEIVSSWVHWILSFWVLLLVSPLNTTLLWSDGEDVAIYVSSGSDTITNGANIEPPLTGKPDILLYLNQMLPLLYSKRSSNYVSHLYCLLIYS